MKRPDMRQLYLRIWVWQQRDQTGDTYTCNIWIWQWRVQKGDTYTCVSESGNEETRHLTPVPVYLNLAVQRLDMWQLYLCIWIWAVKRPDMWNLYLCIWVWRWRAPRPQSPWCVVHRFRPCGWWWWVHWATPGRGHRLCSLHVLHTARGSPGNNTAHKSANRWVVDWALRWSGVFSSNNYDQLYVNPPPPPGRPPHLPPAPPPPPPPAHACASQCAWTP